MASGPHSEFDENDQREFAPSKRVSTLGLFSPNSPLPRSKKRPSPRVCAERALAYGEKHSQRSIDELKVFLRFPSISTSPMHAGRVRDCAEWLAGHLSCIGFPKVQIFHTPLHPIVCAFSHYHPRRPTLLIYGHYDVQPIDPLKEWKSPPFSPVVRGENLYARGASDDKGQLFLHVKAAESYLRACGSPPINLKCVFEGEEEIGSPHFADFVSRNGSALRADFAVISDTRMLGPNRPVITYSERGLLSCELSVRGSRHDLHSGAFGGAIHNPVQVLCEMIALLHDRKGRIAIPGFYDTVRGASPGERAYLKENAPSDAKILRDAGVENGWGEPGFSLFERTTLRPALTVNGIKGGYQGRGGKGILPSRASAKLSFRLVPDQGPEEVEQKLRRFLTKAAPPTLSVKLRAMAREKPVLLDPRHLGVRVAAWAYRKSFGADPVFLRSGGTIPVVNTLEEALKVRTVLMGFALPDDRMHASNEKFFLPNFHRGIAASILFMTGLAERAEARSAGA
jgi:acetylornithine deacetylase/succinyl-diaminopimelate desuccinylase-like protein